MENEGRTIQEGLSQASPSQPANQSEPTNQPELASLSQPTNQSEPTNLTDSVREMKASIHLKNILHTISKENPRLGKFLVESLKRKDEELKEVATRYGLDLTKCGDKSTAYDIIRAEEEQRLCADCNGEECRQSSGNYYKPFIGQEIVCGRREWHICWGLCKYGEVKAAMTRCKSCGIPERFAGKFFESYEVTADNKRAVTLAMKFLKDKPNQGLYLSGVTGSGKTFLASIIAQRYAMDYSKVVFGDVPSLLNEIKRTFNNPELNTEDVLNRYRKCSLLVLDDVGAGYMTEWSLGILYDVINARYNTGRRLIATSNYSFSELERRFNKIDEWSGRRIISRLTEMCVAADLGNVDRRKKQWG